MYLNFIDKNKNFGKIYTRLGSVLIYRYNIFVKISCKSIKLVKIHLERKFKEEHFQYF